MEQGRPKVFISSTIYDFRDLRSAIKLWLNEYGYEVLLSEFNDFPQIPGKNSYDSCLRAIDESDYFVLFIGGRVGGWYDLTKRVSITRMEYQYAYERFKQGFLQILVFVRKEIWDVREDRQALKKFLEDEADLDKELSPAVKTRLISHPSKFLNDATFVIEFIHEAGRVEEMKQAIAGVSGFPSGNWIYQFASFRDVVDACRSVLDLSGSLRQKTLRTNLKHEVISVLRELLERTESTVQPVTHWSKFARASFQGGFGDNSTYKGSHLVWLGMFLLFACSGKRLRITALQESITSGEFLDFDKSSGRHTVGLLQNALLQLDEQIAKFNSITPQMWDVGMMLVGDQRIKNDRKAMFKFPNEQLVKAFAVHDLVENIISLCRAIFLAIEGDENPLSAMQLHPSSPIRDENEKIENERTRIEDVQAWIDAERVR